MKSYEIELTRLAQPDATVFDTKYEGVCFEHIENLGDLQVGVVHADGDSATVIAQAVRIQHQDEAAAERMIEDHVARGDPNVRHFRFRGHPAVATVSHVVQEGPLCAGCSGGQRSMIDLYVGIASEGRVVTLVGTAEEGTSKPTLCELQAALASVTW